MPEKTDGAVEPAPYSPTVGEKGDIKDVPGDQTSIREIPLPPYDDAEGLGDKPGPLETAEEIVTHVIHVDDDPTLSPWTFRMFFIGKYMENIRISLISVNPD